MSAARGALEVPGSRYSEKALYAEEAFVVFLLLLFSIRNKDFPVIRRYT